MKKLKILERFRRFFSNSTVKIWLFTAAILFIIMLVIFISEQKTNSAINFLRGDFTDEDTLIKAQIKNADRVMILADKSEQFSTLETDSRTVLAVITIKNLNPRIYCVA